MGVRTDVGHDAGDDDLGAAGGLDGGAEVGVVPGVDLALALDERRAGVHVADLLGDEAVGAVLGRGGQDDGEVREGLADGRVGHHVVPEESGI